jgi:hypothetical protein
MGLCASASASPSKEAEAPLPENKYGEAIGGGPGGSAPIGNVVDVKTAVAVKRLDPKDFMAQKLDGQTVIKPPGSINGQQFIIEDCKVHASLCTLCDRTISCH